MQIFIQICLVILTKATGNRFAGRYFIYSAFRSLEINCISFYLTIFSLALPLAQDGTLKKRRVQGRGKSSVASSESELFTLIRYLTPLLPPPFLTPLTQLKAYQHSPVFNSLLSLTNFLLCAMGRMININAYRFTNRRQFNELNEKL